MFYQHYKRVEKIFASIPFQEVDKNQRLKDIKKEFLLSCKKRDITLKYFGLLHEINCFDLLYRTSEDIQITNDSRKQKSRSKGPDVCWKNVHIEFVTATKGDKARIELDNFPSEGLIDYGAKLKIIMSRFTQALNSKLEQKPDDTKPFYIFLGLADLLFDFHVTNYGFEMNKVLMGIGDFQLKIDRKTLKVVSNNYSRVDSFDKNNGSQISSNFFRDNPTVSGVLVSYAHIEDLYSDENSVMYYNPFCDLCDEDLIPGIIYWSVREGLYQPMKNGVILPQEPITII